MASKKKWTVKVLSYIKCKGEKGAFANGIKRILFRKYTMSCWLVQKGKVAKTFEILFSFFVCLCVCWHMPLELVTWCCIYWAQVVHRRAPFSPMWVCQLKVINLVWVSRFIWLISNVLLMLTISKEILKIVKYFLGGGDWDVFWFSFSQLNWPLKCLLLLKMFLFFYFDLTPSLEKSSQSQ